MFEPRWYKLYELREAGEGDYFHPDRSNSLTADAIPEVLLEHNLLAYTRPQIGTSGAPMTFIALKRFTEVSKKNLENLLWTEHYLKTVVVNMRLPRRRPIMRYLYFTHFPDKLHHFIDFYIRTFNISSYKNYRKCSDGSNTMITLSSLMITPILKLIQLMAVPFSRQFAKPNLLTAADYPEVMRRKAFLAHNESKKINQYSLSEIIDSLFLLGRNALFNSFPHPDLDKYLRSLLVRLADIVLSCGPEDTYDQRTFCVEVDAQQMRQNWVGEAGGDGSGSESASTSSGDSSETDDSDDEELGQAEKMWKINSKFLIYLSYLLYDFFKYIDLIDLVQRNRKKYRDVLVKPRPSRQTISRCLRTISSFSIELAQAYEGIQSGAIVKTNIDRQKLTKKAMADTEKNLSEYIKSLYDSAKDKEEISILQFLACASETELIENRSETQSTLSERTKIEELGELFSSTIDKMSDWIESQYLRTLLLPFQIKYNTEVTGLISKNNTMKGVLTKLKGVSMNRVFDYSHKNINNFISGTAKEYYYYYMMREAEKKNNQDTLKLLSEKMHQHIAAIPPSVYQYAFIVGFAAYMHMYSKFDIMENAVILLHEEESKAYLLGSDMPIFLQIPCGTFVIGYNREIITTPSFCHTVFAWCSIVMINNKGYESPHSKQFNLGNGLKAIGFFRDDLGEGEHASREKVAANEQFWK